MVQLSSFTIKRIKLLAHLTIVGVVLTQLIHTAVYTLPNSWFFFITSDSIENLTSAIIAYTLFYHVFRSRSIWQKVAFILLFVVILVFLGGLKDFRIHNFNSLDQSFEYFTNFLGQTLLIYLVVYAINKLEAINDYKKLERELGEAKERLLRNQMHPHFLFNALNALYSLSLKDSAETGEYILKLSSMMRYLTDETHLNKVPLIKELDFIEKYIEIEKLRFGNGASIKFTREKKLDDKKLIEPFLLISLVENAFKHGFYTNSKNAFVFISLKLENNKLLFYVENSLFLKQHFQEASRTGKGLDSLKQRLKLLYPKSSSLKMNITKTKFMTELKITLD